MPIVPATPWKGRSDTEKKERLFQYVQTARGVESIIPGALCLCGFAVDTGVVRNLGRPGAAQGPTALRAHMANLCVSLPPTAQILDFGDVHDENGDLEGAQTELSVLVQGILRAGGFPVILGGGHETAWGTYQGLMAQGIDPLEILNFDAHLDLRPVKAGKGTSGTPFTQMADACEKENRRFSYSCIGVQSSSNTESLFARAAALETTVILAETCVQSPEKVAQHLQEKLRRAKNLYLSFCLDVIHASVAPGVSAPQGLGLFPAQLFPLLELCVDSPQLVAFEMVEFAPCYDPSGCTGKLAAEILRKVILAYFQREVTPMAGARGKR
jgi:formiminoglutamase